MRTLIVQLIGLVFLSLPCGAESQKGDFAQFFNQGIENFQQKKFAEAETAFQQSLQIEPSNLSALTNLSLAQYELGKKGWALGQLRKVLTIEPRHPQAQQAYAFIWSQLAVKEIPHQISYYEQFRSSFLNILPLTAYLALSVLTLFAAGWSLLRFLERRKTALAEQSSLPGLPWVASLLAVAFVSFSILAIAKAVDQTTLRATIVTEKVNLQAAPGENGVNLGELYEGFEVILLQSSQGWSQVQYPGAVTGWLKSENILLHR